MTVTIFCHIKGISMFKPDTSWNVQQFVSSKSKSSKKITFNVYTFCDVQQEISSQLSIFMTLTFCNFNFRQKNYMTVVSWRKVTWPDYMQKAGVQMWVTWLQWNMFLPKEDDLAPVKSLLFLGCCGLDRSRKLFF